MSPGNVALASGKAYLDGAMVEFLEFVDDYYARFAKALTSFDRKALDGVLQELERVAKKGGNVWVAGNGGSAAISNHAVCDLTKWNDVEGHETLKCHSLAANMPMVTALGNDIGFDDVFSKQLGYYLGKDDAVLLVSSSGNSPNVVNACEYANEQGVPTIAFVGFKGGKLKEIAKHVIWVPVENYGIVEDTHQSLMHVMTQYLRIKKEAAS